MTAADSGPESARTRPLLDIIVPTWNRAACLRLLLETLERELAGLHDRVAVLVSDNGSTDDTPAVLAEFAARLPSLRGVRHAQNLGADENFCRSVEATDGQWFWLFGDDDLPAAGLVRLLLDLLAAQSPDLVNLRSDWMPQLVDNAPDAPLRDLRAWSLDRQSFARRVNVWTTFISGTVVRRDTFAATAGAAGLRRHTATQLVQLSWVLGTLARGTRFLDLRAPCILATSGNTGGYKLIKVFGDHFPAIVEAEFGAGSPLAVAMLRRLVIGFLPTQLWIFRFGHAGDFGHEDVAATLRPRLGRVPGFSLLVAIGHAGRPVAAVALRCCAIVNRLVRLADRASAWWAGSRRLT